MLHSDSAVRRVFRKRSALKQHVVLSTRRALLLSSSVFIIGLWLSVNQNDWSWFARSGSMIVVIGIFLTSSQIIENSRKLRIRRSRHEQNFHRDYADEIKRGTLDRSRSLDEDIWENGLRGFYLLVAGTLVWGFGDLVGYLF
ncbi:MAG: hypothetical protein PVG45_04635 [Gammaproteobacteria bacterium]